LSTQKTALFQPRNLGGYGFPKLSHVIQDQQLALPPG